MHELANAIAQKTGLSHEQAMVAAQAALDFLMTRLPAPVTEQIKSALGGSSGMGDVKTGLGGMLGKK